MALNATLDSGAAGGCTAGDSGVAKRSQGAGHQIRGRRRDFDADPEAFRPRPATAVGAIKRLAGGPAPRSTKILQCHSNGRRAAGERRLAKSPASARQAGERHQRTVNDKPWSGVAKAVHDELGRLRQSSCSTPPTDCPRNSERLKLEVDSFLGPWAPGGKRAIVIVRGEKREDLAKQASVVVTRGKRVISIPGSRW